MDSADKSFDGSPPARVHSTDLTSSNDIFLDSPTRQQRLLQSRNARFPAKKLSISSLSSKLTQLIGNNEQQDGPENPPRNQENKLRKSKSVSTISRGAGLSILEEISYSTKSRGLRRRPDIPIFQDNPERPLLGSSPGILSSPPVEVDSNDHSPANFDHIKDSLNEMRLRDISVNERWSPLIPSPSTGKTKRKKSAQSAFDADEYIEHIEKELQQVREEAYSPLTRRPMKEKLRAANKENERLQKELAQLKDKFEAEVKKTVEHKTATEFELRRRVRDLEDSLDQKDNLVRELQFQHEERRLDSNVLDSLKATIEKLEHDKLEMEEINLSMTKRNEVLTQLLAMSPTKMASGFNLGSPVKEKRNGRPLSLMLPRQPASPRESQQSQASSLACSPLSVNSVDISPLKLSNSYSPAEDVTSSPEEAEARIPTDGARSPPLCSGPNRRWTTYADLSGAFLGATDEHKPVNRRKARKFVSGSTQLKPLLLPTLNGDNVSVPSSSTFSSPRFSPRYADTDAEQDETILASDHAHQEPESLSLDESSPQAEDGSPGPACLSTNLEEQLNASLEDNPFNRHVSTVTDTSEPFVWHSHSRDMSFYVSRRQSCSSLQDVPIPSTPESLVARPRALFSQETQSSNHSASPPISHGRSASLSAVLESSIKLRKRRRPSLSPSGQSPQPKLQRLDRRHSSARTSLLAFADARTKAPQPASIQRRLANVRSHDNVVELLRQKNFAVKPLAAMTIKIAYKILATCAATLRDFKSQPFALARRMLANAWYMHWKLLGKVSWWVLGLFIQPQHIPRQSSPINWDRYDGESIANRYCGTTEYLAQPHESCADGDTRAHALDGCPAEPEYYAEPPDRGQKPGWGQSLFLWGKFSAALLLAVGGAVVKGPGEMLKDLPTARYTCCPAHRACEGCHSPIPGSQQRPIAVYGRLATHQDHLFHPKHGRSCAETLRDHSLQNCTDFINSSVHQHGQQDDFETTLRPPLPPRPHVGGIFQTLQTSDGHKASSNQD